MGAYILSVSVASVIASVICILCPEKYSKFISFASSLAVMAVMLSPLSNVKSISINIPETDVKTEAKDTKSVASRALARSVTEVIYGKFSTGGCIDSITVSTTDSEDFEVTEINITILSNSEISDPSAMAKYLSELYGVEVIINEKQA